MDHGRLHKLEQWSGGLLRDDEGSPGFHKQQRQTRVDVHAAMRQVEMDPRIRLFPIQGPVH
jgi:hypothetical protein